MTQPAPETSRDESPFWRFSLRFYRAPKCRRRVSGAAGEAGGGRENLLLFLLFWPSIQRQVSVEDVAMLDAAVLPWRDSVVKPLRALRRALKSGSEKFPGRLAKPFADR